MSRLPALKEVVRTRLGWLGFTALVAAVFSLASASPPEATVSGLVGWLGAQTNLFVRIEDFRWAPSSGFIGDRILGRRLLFLGATSQGGQRDLYQARVRLGDAGQPLSLSLLRNLTNTPLGDDMGLEVHGERASFATSAYGRLQAITVFDLDGVRTEDKSGGYFSGFLRSLTHLQLTGTWFGIGRTDLLLQVPVVQAELSLNDTHLGVRLGTTGRELEYDLAARRVRAKDGSQAHGVRVIPNQRPPKPLVLWAVDTVREEIGPEPIAWLEDKVFGVRDVIRRTSYNLTASSSETALNDTLPVAEASLDASKISTVKENWPPKNLPSLWKQVEPDEGVWQAVNLPFLRPSLAVAGNEKPDAYFYKTFIRPDPARPYAKLWLVAMDMRQLDLNMRAGFEDPEPLTGPPGDGRLPEDKGVLDRVVATFNGAFKSEHGSYGMMVQKRVLLPPVAGGASILVDGEHEIMFGSWPKSQRITDDIIAYRQNLDPLVEDGKANPTGRQLWGWQLEGKSVLTERTAVCLSTAGHVYYAWGPEIDGPTLGKALSSAGCSYAVHLDMNPGHCGMVFTRIDDLAKRQYSVQHAVSRMTIPVDRYVRWSPKDFFYVTLRDPRPKASGGFQFEVDPGTQPSPAWWPGIYRGKTDTTPDGVEIVSFERGRFNWALTAGTREPTEVGAQLMKTALTGDDAHHVLAAIGLSHTTGATRLGIAFDGKQSIPLRPKFGTLVIRAGAPLTVVTSDVPKLEPTDSAIQFPLLALASTTTHSGRAQGPLRERAALCITPGQRVLVGKTRSDSSAALVAALLREGCTDVVELDRGSSAPSFIHRAGTDLPPTGDYESSVLYVLGRSMIPHAGRWALAGSAKNGETSSYDTPHPR